MSIIGTDTMTLSGGSAEVNTISTATGSSLIISSGLSINANPSSGFNTLAGAVTIGSTLDAKNIDALSGVNIALAGPGIVLSSGNIETGILATATFAMGSTYTIAAGGGMDGEGTYVIDAALTVAGLLSPGAIVLNSNGTTTAGVITGPSTGSLNIGDDFTWTGGTISVGGGVTVEQNSEFSVEGPNACTLGTDLSNNSYRFDVNSPLTLATGITLTNVSGLSTVDLSSTIMGGGTFVNDSILSCDSTTVAAVISSGLTENGSIDLGIGALSLTLSGAGTLAGDITLNSDTLYLTGTYTVAANTKFETMYSIDGLIALMSGGTLTLTSGGEADFDHFRLDGGTLAGSGAMNIGASNLHPDDNFDWFSGTITGTGTLTVSGITYDNQLQGCHFNILGTGTTTLDGWTLNLGGITNWSGGTLILTSSPTIHNEAGALFEDEGTGSFAPFGGSATFTNGGYFLKDTASGTGTLAMLQTFNNSSGGGATDGLVEVKSGTLSISGGGSSSGTFQADDGATVQFTMDSYTLTGGGLAGAGTIENNETASNTALTVTGSVELSGGVTLLNDQNATIQVSADMTAGTGGGTIVNNGTFTATSTATIGVTFDNDNGGMVETQAGTLSLAGGGSSNGTLGTTSGATLQFAQQGYTITGGTITGNGTIDNATTLILSVSMVFGQNFTNEGTVEAQAGTLSFTGGGSSSGTFQADSGTTIQLSQVSYTLTGGGLAGSGALTNSTVLSVTGDLALSGGVTLINESSGQIQDSSDVTLGSGGGVLDNEGSYVKTSGSGTASIDVTFNNYGTAESQVGTLGINGGGTSASGSSFNSDNGAVLVFGNDTYTLEGGTTLNGPGAFGVTGGLVVVTGSVAGTQGMGFTLRGGTLQLTDTGSLGVAAFTELAGATLEIDLGATSYGTLDVQGVAALAGALNVVSTGYNPQPGDNLPVIDYGSYSGSFGSVTVPDGLDYAYNTSSFNVYDPS